METGRLAEQVFIRDSFPIYRGPAANNPGGRTARRPISLIFGYFLQEMQYKKYTAVPQGVAVWNFPRRISLRKFSLGEYFAFP